MDRCRVWESHADPEIRRVSKPGPELIYPAYVVGDPDKVVEEIRDNLMLRESRAAGESVSGESG